MAEKENTNWKQKFALGAMIAATLSSIGLKINSNSHENIQNTKTSPSTISTFKTHKKDKTETEKKLILEINRSFQNSKFYQNIEQYGFENINSDFKYVFNNILNEDISWEEIVKCIKSLKNIVDVSKKLNSKYIELLNKNPDCDNNVLLQNNLYFYKNLNFDHYISLIQSLLMKNKNYEHFGIAVQYQILNLHAFVGIKHHK